MKREPDNVSASPLSASPRLPQARPLLRPLRGPEEFEALKAPAHADGHRVLLPTHLVDREGEVIGYVSIGALPLVLGWLDRSKARPVDSLAVFRQAEDFVRMQGGRAGLLACSSRSPFYPVIPRHGYELIGTTTLFHKVL